jgi:hypothetical protein
MMGSAAACARCECAGGGKYSQAVGVTAFTFWLGSITGVTAIQTLIGVQTDE